MKTLFLLITMFITPASLIFAQDNPVTVLPLLGEKAPSFTANSTNGIINFPQDFGSDWKVIFCHPADFTPVCTSELIELAAIQEDLKKMHVDLIVVSTDNAETHTQWVKSVESLDYKNRKTTEIKFPLIDDQNHSIAKKYGMIHPANNTTKDVRGVFIVDPDNKISAMFYYPANIGRNMDEIKRTILALQTADKKNILTPANWQAGNDVMLPYLNYTTDKLDLARKEDPNLYEVSWYMWLTKLK